MVMVRAEVVAVVERLVEVADRWRAAYRDWQKAIARGERADAGGRRRPHPVRYASHSFTLYTAGRAWPQVGAGESLRREGTVAAARPAMRVVAAAMV